MIHVSTGLIESRQGRLREHNYKEARNALEQRIKDDSIHKLDKEISINRKHQVGSGMRGDKIRTYRFKDNIVLDHKSGKKAKCSKIMKGNFNLLW